VHVPAAAAAPPADKGAQDARVVQLEAALRAERDVVSSLTTARTAAEGELSGLRSALTSRDATIAARDACITALQRDVAAAQAATADRDATIKVRNQTIASLQRDASSVAAVASEKDATIKARDAAISAHLATIKARDDTIAAAQRDLASALARLAEVQATLSLREATIREQEANIHKLTATVTATRAILSQPPHIARESAELCPDDVAIVRNARHDRVRLGGGAQADVYASTLDCVVKVPKLASGKTTHTDAAVAAFWNEVAFHQPLCHPYIVAVHGGAAVTDADGRVEELQLVMEMCRGGTLERRLFPDDGTVASPPPPLKQRLTWGLQVLSALSYLHLRDIIHADVKLENVLLADKTPSSRAKLCDFGLSVRRRDDAVTRASLLTFRGSLAYVDPRLLSSDAPAGGAGDDSGSIRKASDVYSAGVMLWELATLKRPYDGLKYPPEAMAAPDLQLAHFVKHVRTGSRPATAEQAAIIAPAGLGDLIARMWAARAEDRPTMAAAVEELGRLVLAVRDSPPTRPGGGSGAVAGAGKPGGR
jgi:hypothetical protein